MSEADDKSVAVSVLCHTYNHVAYIKQALDSFLAQKTNFRYEVIVHDDASTDGTAEIIREYQRCYPDIIVPIIQKENKNSKGIDVYSVYTMPKASGRYIAMCDGDDYWIDNDKLQMQYDVLEANDMVDICATGWMHLNGDMYEKALVPSNENRLFTTDEVIAGGGGFVATASLFYRKSSCKDLMYGFDYFIQIYGSVRGGMFYIAKNTCIYRMNVVGSWTQRTRRDAQFYCNSLKCINYHLQRFNEKTSYKFHDVVEGQLIRNGWLIERMSWNVEGMFDRRYEKYFMQEHEKIQRIAKMLRHIPNPLKYILRKILIKNDTGVINKVITGAAWRLVEKISSRRNSV